MKQKILIITLFLLILGQVSFAQDLSAYCAQPHDLSSKTTRFLSNVTGTTAISQNIANALIKRELRNSAGMKGLKVKIKSFSANDLLAGRFKSLTLNGSNLDFNGVHVSKFSAKTICDFNNIRATGNPIIFRDNFAMQYDIAISSDFIVGFAGETEEDFNETLEICKKVNYDTTFSFTYSNFLFNEVNVSPLYLNTPPVSFSLHSFKYIISFVDTSNTIPNMI